MSNFKYLTWQNKVPTRAGLYIRTKGQGDLALFLVSVEHFFDGSIKAHLATVHAQFMPRQSPGRGETLFQLPGDRQPTQASFLGPIKLPCPPAAKTRAKSGVTVPTEPGIYYLSRDLGHAWKHELIAVGIHRYQLSPDATRDELIYTDLATLEEKTNLEQIPGAVMTLALPQLHKLNLQQLRK